MNSSNNLLKHGTLMFVATSVVNVFNYVFHIYMGRALGPSGYGILASLMSLLMIVSVPAGSLQTVVTKYVAGFKAQNEHKKIGYFLVKLLQRMFWYCVLAFVVFIMLSGAIAAFLKVPSTVPVIIMGMMMLVSFISPIPYGGLQGLQNFKHLSINVIAGALLKVVFGVLFVALGFGVSGAIAALTLSSIAAFFLAFVPLRFVLSQRVEAIGISSSEMKRYFWPVVVVLLCFAVLTNIDVVIVKHFFPSAKAGTYAAAAIFGKIVLFFPGAIATVMFPKTAELHALEEDTRPILKRSLLTVAGLCTLVTIGYFVFPFLIVSLLFGSRYYQSIPLMGLFGVAMTLFSMLNILILYFLSVHNFRFIFFLVACTLLQVALLWYFHSTLQTVLYVLIGNGFLLLVLNWAYISWVMPRTGFA